MFLKTMLPIFFFTIYNQLSNISCQFFNFRMNISPKVEKCLSEFMFKNSVVYFETNSISRKTKTLIRNPKNKVLIENAGTSFHFSFIADKEGYYKLCVENLDTVNNEVSIEFKSGVSLKDFSSVPKEKNIAPIDAELDRISKREYIMMRIAKRAYFGKEDFDNFYDTVTGRIIKYSIFMIIGMIVVAFLETYYLKRFMERRKII